MKKIFSNINANMITSCGLLIALVIALFVMANRISAATNYRTTGIENVYTTSSGVVRVTEITRNGFGEIVYQKNYPAYCIEDLVEEFGVR